MIVIAICVVGIALCIWYLVTGGLMIPPRVRLRNDQETIPVLEENPFLDSRRKRKELSTRAMLEWEREFQWRTAGERLLIAIAHPKPAMLALPPGELTEQSRLLLYQQWLDVTMKQQFELYHAGALARTRVPGPQPPMSSTAAQAAVERELAIYRQRNDWLKGTHEYEAAWSDRRRHTRVPVPGQRDQYRRLRASTRAE